MKEGEPEGREEGEVPSSMTPDTITFSNAEIIAVPLFFLYQSVHSVAELY